VAFGINHIAGMNESILAMTTAKDNHPSIRVYRMRHAFIREHKNLTPVSISFNQSMMAH
jgi:hypothetical protein